VGSYDPRYPLVIDPGLDYSTFLGGTNGDIGQGIAVDGRGRAYVTGSTFSTDYPTTPGAFDTILNSTDAFVTTLSARGSALRYSTFLGERASMWARASRWTEGTRPM
jgi:Beta-propeller repeat